MLDTNDPRFSRDTRLEDERHKVARLMAELEFLGVSEEDEILTAIEGETDALEAISLLLRRIGESGALMQGLGQYITDLQARKNRVSERAERLRRAILNFMQEFGLKTIERPEATVSFARGQQRIAYAPDFNAIDLPVDLQKITIEPDKTKVNAAMKAGAELKGVYLTNGEPCLTVRVK